MSVPELSQFQLESLQDVACNPLGMDTYMLCQPNPEIDSIDIVMRWTKNNMETEQLIEWGLLNDISNEFTKEIEENRKLTGHTVRVLRISKLGREMFNKSTQNTAVN